MPPARLWRPTFRCDRCRAMHVLQGLRAWLGQPPAQDGGRVHFVCRGCRARTYRNVQG